MKEELSLREIINEVILFFINFRKIIITITILGTLSVIVFQKLRPAYYNTMAIATSGISTFERIDDEDILDQRVAINIINLLQSDIKKEDYVIVSDKLNISLENASSIKSIRAKEIFRKDQDNKEHSTPKFSIELSIKNNKSINMIQDGLVYYFNTNKYISTYYDQFLSTTSSEIIAIDSEVEELRVLRRSEKSVVDISSVNLYSNKNQKQVNNQILGLISLRSKNTTNQRLLKPLSFVQPFTISQIPERGVLILGSVAAVISFLLGIFIAIFMNVHQKSEK
jgi:hypothetical protein